ncbi:MAG TPA: preprotein translocase subunit SecE [Mycobacteriales bacterium]|nr:preprotein translocase subunit SecE [Mycobacteriales bacterium]HWA65582.1 preprotein translocase subunit SecE [Mycobacteriales bacterium]
MTQTNESMPTAKSARSGRGKGGKPGYPERISTYNRQVVSELRKVLWPTRNELVTYTVVSVTFVVAMVAFVGALDYGFTKAVFSLFG